MFFGTNSESLTQSGHVFWITGLAGAGKTTIAKYLYESWKKSNPSLVLLDGDTLRQLFGEASYTPENRLKLAIKYGELCRLLSLQGIDILCSTISMFDQCRKWNRSNIIHYFEIYVRVSPQILKQRDQKSLYSQALKGNTHNVVGVDLPFEEPKNPDLIVENNGEKSITELCDEIINNLPKRFKKNENCLGLH